MAEVAFHATTAALTTWLARDAVAPPSDSSGRVLGVDLHVVEAQIAGHDAPRPCRASDRSSDRIRASFMPFAGSRERVGVQRAAAREPNPAETHLEPIEVERDAGLARRHHDSAEIRIAAEERGLDQRRIGDLPRDAIGVARRCARRAPRSSPAWSHLHRRAPVRARARRRPPSTASLEGRKLAPRERAIAAPRRSPSAAACRWWTCRRRP